MTDIGRLEVIAESGACRFVSAIGVAGGILLEQLAPVGPPLDVSPRYNLAGRSSLTDSDLANGLFLPDGAEAFMYLSINRSSEGRQSAVIQCYRIR